MAEARRNSEIKKSWFQAEIDQAAARARQAGPLAEAVSRQEVVVQETTIAELEAKREEQRLQASVRKPADAKAYEQVTLSKAGRDARIAQAEAHKQEVELQAQADAQRVKLTAAAEAEQVRARASAQAESVRAVGDAEASAIKAESVRAVADAEASAIKAKGMAEGDAVRAKGMAEADAIKARADALADNQDAVIGHQLAEQWPAIVEAAAKPFGSVDQMIVLNGAQGLSEVLAQATSEGVAGLQMVRQLLGANGTDSTNGTHAAKGADGPGGGGSGGSGGGGGSGSGGGGSGSGGGGGSGTG
jgi:uncharacterized membrane protein YqiK